MPLPLFWFDEAGDVSAVLVFDRADGGDSYSAVRASDDPVFVAVIGERTVDLAAKPGHVFADWLERAQGRLRSDNSVILRRVVAGTGVPCEFVTGSGEDWLEAKRLLDEWRAAAVE